MPWGAVIGGVISAIGAGSAADKNAKAAKKAAAQGTMSSQAPWSAQDPYLRDMFAEAQRLYQGGQLSQVAGFTGDENIGRQGARDAATSIQGMLPGANAAWQQQLNAPNLQNNPYIQDYINAALNPIQDRLQQSILPGIRGDAVSSGMFGGSRQGVGEGNAIGQATRAMGDTTSGIINAAYNTGMQQQGRALTMSPIMAQLQTLGPDILRQLGLDERMMNQSQLDSAYQGLNRYQSMVGGQNWGSQGRVVSPNFVGNNAVGAGIGGAASGLALYNMLNQPGGGGQTSYGGNTYGDAGTANMFSGQDALFQQ